jgi:hypothetical protein
MMRMSHFCFIRNTFFESQDREPMSKTDIIIIA